MILSETLLRQTRIHFPRFEEAEVKISPIEKGGSDRKFYRIEVSPEQRIVLVKYSRALAENQRYVEIAEFLATHGVRAPKIYFHDPTEGLIWIEDLGERDLWSYRDESWPVRLGLYQSALEEIAKLHRVSAADSERIRRDLPAQFDAALYLWEQHYFFENCLGRRFGLSEEERKELMNLPVLKEIAERLASFPRVLIHRDFQSQNIILRNGQAYLIDFQGMRPGLAEYDLASLLYDPYVKLTESERAELQRFYRVMARIDNPDFVEKFRFSAMQRLMQALGAYSYLGLVKGNKAFLAHIPTALDSLGEILSGIPGLEPLHAVTQASGLSRRAGASKRQARRPRDLTAGTAVLRTHKRIAAPLLPDRGGGTVTGQDGDVVT